ncbi:phosphoribosyl-ATP diphosphatase [Novosphingobium ginsenosidimutans]|uniref:Phosphoribosyl-ATP pyrophosphatase n=1 Tax=Novosphingobium ginsenosidimutans TaxID=1176536 RepID=A0A5B8S2E9_9SPHN|nr:phosphoribosyl-ATP diphosphatase [Novosphingobium ginsenosidimutans]QEA15649.1 phosphoribosyl-ATP diphosphatase [Novosphingobium ginsenosidimutans]
MDTISRLEAVIRARFDGDPGSSYVAKLHAKGGDAVAQKVGEEAVELIIAHLAGTHEQEVAEAADLIFHLLILLAEHDIPFAQVLAELERREGTSGIAEKASRSE